MASREHRGLTAVACYQTSTNKVYVTEPAVVLHVRRTGLNEVFNLADTDTPELGPIVIVSLPVRIRTRGVETKLVLEDGSSKARKPDPALLKVEGLALTPHIGAATLEAQDRIGDELVERILEMR